MNIENRSPKLQAVLACLILSSCLACLHAQPAPQTGDSPKKPENKTDEKQDPKNALKKIIANLARSVAFDPLHPNNFIRDVVVVSVADLLEAVKTSNLSKQDLDYLISHGAAEFYAGNNQAALDDFDKALKITPKSADLLSLRASAKIAMGDYKGGAADYVLATEIKPEDSSLWSFRGAAEGASVIAAHKADPSICIENSYTTWKDEEFDPAMKSFERALSLNPNEALACYCRGYLKMVKGDSKGALQDMLSASRIAPNDIDILIGVGIAQNTADKRDDSITTLSRAIRLYPGCARAFNNRGVTRADQGDLMGGITDFTKAIELRGDYAIAFLNRGFVRLGNGETKEAIKDFQTAYGLTKSRVLRLGCLTAMANAKYMDGDIKGGERDFAKALEIDPKDPAIYLNRAQTRLKAGNITAAEKDLKTSASMDPDNAWNHLLGGAIKAERKDYPGAIAEFNEALKIQPDLIFGLINRSMAKNALKDWHGSIEDANKALEMNPDFQDASQAHFIIGVATEGGTHDIKKSVAEYRRAIELNPRHDRSYWKLAFSKSLEGDHAGAITDCNRALEINPKNADALMQRGSSKAAIGDYEGGIKDLDSAVIINPNDYRLFGQRGAMKQDHGDYDGAIGDYKKALEIEPNNQFLITELERSKSLKSNGGRMWGKDYQVMLEQALAKLEAGDRTGARQILEQATQKYPNVHAAFTELGKMKASDGDLQGGLALLGRAIGISSGDFVSRMVRGTLLAQSGNPREALEDLNIAVMGQPTNGVPLIIRAAARGDSGDIDGAERDLDAAEKLMPGHADIAVMRGKIAAARSGKPTQALPQAPQPTSVEAEVSRNLQEGWAMAANGNFDGALAAGNKAAGLNPNDNRVFVYLGRIKEARSDINGALAAYQRALEINPQDGMAYSNRAMMKTNLKDWPGVIEDATKAIALNPQEVFSYLNRGKAKANTGDLQGGLLDYDSGIARLQPADPMAYCERAQIKEALNQWSGAVADYDKALMLAPNDSHLIQRKQRAQSEIH